MAGSQRVSIAYLRVNDEDIRLKYADLVALRRDSGELDWEVVAYGLDAERQFEPGAYHLSADGLLGETIGGDAILVRSIDGVHVFRGAGEITGLPDAT